MMINTQFKILAAVFLAHPTTLAAVKNLPQVKSYKSSAAAAVPYAVNMQDGGLILKENQGGPLLNVERIYRSRSLHKGFFGQGWCTDFESELQFQGGGVVRLENCHSPRPNLFKLESHAGSYTNQDNPKEEIKIRMGHYEHLRKNKLIAKYNFQGKLIEVFVRGQSWSLKYDDRKLPTQINNSKGIMLSLKWHPVLTLVEQIQMHPTYKIDFKYEGFNLMKVVTKDGKTSETYMYDYDDLDNLILRKNSNSTLRFDYIKELDQIRKIYADCDEEYEFKVTSHLKRTGLIRKICANKTAVTTMFEFEYQIDSRIPAQVKIENILPQNLKTRVAQRHLEQE